MAKIEREKGKKEIASKLKSYGKKPLFRFSRGKQWWRAKSEEILEGRKSKKKKKEKKEYNMETISKVRNKKKRRRAGRKGCSPKGCSDYSYRRKYINERFLKDRLTRG